MTFIPSVLSKYDPNNSIISSTGTSSYIGTSTEITGVLSINININANNNSLANGIIVSASVDGTTFTTYFTDTYFANTNYQKTLNLICKYYKLSVFFGSSTNFTVVTYLNTDFNQDGGNGVYLPAKVEAHYDAFGKLRVSNPYTLIDLKYPPLNNSLNPDPTPDYLKNNLQMIYYNDASGSATYGNSQGIFTQTDTGTIISQSRKYCIYQPGKSLLCLASFVLNTNTSTSATSTSTDYSLRIGYFDDYNGIFLQYAKSGGTGTISFVLRSNTINAASVNNGTTYSQSAWNIDKLDGTGNSGILLDFTKSQLLVIDLEWLSVGRVRCGFMCFGKIVYCHQITNMNSITGPYMYTANLPVRYEVVNNDATGGKTAILTKICATVVSEGGYRPSGNIFSVTTLSVDSIPNTAEYSVLFLTGNVATGNSNYYHNEIILRSLAVYCSTSDVLQYRIRLYLPGDNPSPSGSPPTYVSVASTSVLQYAIGSNTTTTIPGNSIILDQGYVNATSVINVLQSVGEYIINNNSITSNVNNTEVGHFVVTLQSISNTGGYNASVSLNWAEF